MAGILPSLHPLFSPKDFLLQHELDPPKLPPKVPPINPRFSSDSRHDKTTLISPFRPQNVPVDPAKHLPALAEEQKKDESRHRPRISLYRWLGQRHGEPERRVKFEMEEKTSVEPSKETKEAMETIVENLLEPKVSANETKEYERYPLFPNSLLFGVDCRYIAHPRSLTMTVHEKAHPEYLAYVNDAVNSTYCVDESDLKLYDTVTTLGEKTLAMRATLMDKDEISRRKAQGYQTWVKGQQRKLERS